VELDFWGWTILNCFSINKSLNPYSGGTWFLRSKNNHKIIKMIVLILILVELDFWAVFDWPNNNFWQCLNPYSGGTWFLSGKSILVNWNMQGLNPYSGGTWFLRESLPSLIEYKGVLILILVELDFWAAKQHGILSWRKVLILILVELDFWAKQRGF